MRTDPSKGIEGNQGYYFISKKTAETFYNMMAKKDKMLPESALKFQEIKEQIENYIVNYQ